MFIDFWKKLEEFFFEKWIKSVMLKVRGGRGAMFIQGATSIPDSRVEIIPNFKTLLFDLLATQKWIDFYGPIG